MQHIYYSTSNKTVTENYMIESSENKKQNAHKKSETKHYEWIKKYCNLSSELYNSFLAGNLIQIQIILEDCDD